MAEPPSWADRAEYMTALHAVRLAASRELDRAQVGDEPLPEHVEAIVAGREASERYRRAVILARQGTMEA